MSKWSPRPEDAETFPISETAAEEQVREILRFYRIDLDEIEDEKSKQAFCSVLNRIRTAFRRGQLEIKRESGRFKIAQHVGVSKDNPKGTETLLYDELSGAAKPNMDGFDQNDLVKRQYALLGGLCGLGIDAIKQLRGNDLGVAECLGTLFFMV
jgi:hypothetical protein